MLSKIFQANIHDCFTFEYSATLQKQVANALAVQQSQFPLWTDPSLNYQLKCILIKFNCLTFVQLNLADIIEFYFFH